MVRGSARQGEVFGALWSGNRRGWRVGTLRRDRSPLQKRLRGTKRAEYLTIAMLAEPHRQEESPREEPQVRPNGNPGARSPIGIARWSGNRRTSGFDGQGIGALRRSGPAKRPVGRTERAPWPIYGRKRVEYLTIRRRSAANPCSPDRAAAIGSGLRRDSAPGSSGERVEYLTNGAENLTRPRRPPYQTRPSPSPSLRHPL